MTIPHQKDTSYFSLAKYVNGKGRMSQKKDLNPEEMYTHIYILVFMDSCYMRML